MPYKIDPKKNINNGVGRVFKVITLTLSIVLPISTIAILFIWGSNNGFEKFL